MAETCFGWIKIRLIDFERHRAIVDKLKSDEGLSLDFEGPVVHMEGIVGLNNELAPEIAAPLRNASMPFNFYIQSEQLGEPDILGYWRSGMENLKTVAEPDTEAVPVNELEALLRENPASDCAVRALRARIEETRNVIPPLLSGESQVSIA